MSQTTDILEHMRKFGTITPAGAYSLYSCFRLAARISDLKRQGHNIDMKLIKSGDKVWASYSLVPGTGSASINSKSQSLQPIPTGAVDVPGCVIQEGPFWKHLN